MSATILNLAPPQSRIDEARDELAHFGAKLTAEPWRSEDPQFMRAFDIASDRYAHLRRLGGRND